MKPLHRLERWMYRFQVKPFIRYLIYAMAAVYALQLFVPSLQLYRQLMLYVPYVMQGQLWRLLSFLVVPLGGSPLTVLLSMYFYYFIGTSLEARWGARRFLLYFAIGAFGAILAAFITGLGTNHYVYQSMFFAFAVLQPERELLLFFFLPVKMKWLALLNAAYYVYAFITGAWPQRVALLLSLMNVILFFGGDIVNLTRSEIERFRMRQRFRNLRR